MVPKVKNEAPAPAWLGAPEAGKARRGRQGRPVPIVQATIVRCFANDTPAAGRVLADLLCSRGPHMRAAAGAAGAGAEANDEQ